MNASELRKQLQKRLREAAALLWIVKQRQPLIRGRVYKLRRKCGKPTCRCQAGQLHESWVLSIPDKGRKRMRAVPKDKRLIWQPRADEYRRFRRARARLVKLFAEITGLVDAMERARTVPPAL